MNEILFFWTIFVLVVQRGGKKEIHFHFSAKILHLRGDPQALTQPTEASE